MIRYTGWAREAISPETAYEIGKRAISLEADAGVLRSGGFWVGRAKRGAYRTGAHRCNTVAAALTAALDELEAGEEFSAEELVTIAAQSGLEVRRA